MATVNKNKRGLHRKAWEMCTYSPAGATVAGIFMTGDKYGHVPNSGGLMYEMNGTSLIFQYLFDEDAWLQIPNSGMGGTFGAGTCGEFIPLSAMAGLTTQAATAGTTTTITTSRTIAINLRDVKIRVVAGTGVGYEGEILSNTIGANAILTLKVANGVAFDATTQFQIFAGSLWVVNAGTTAFSVYDRATNAWTSRTATGLPATVGTGGMLISTQSLVSGVIESGTSSGTNTTTTINDTSKAWIASAWVNSQIRITGGTGKGQIRKISANTATGITVSVAWVVTPDATSTYAIEGDDDALYFSGNNAVTLYKYSISANTWVTLTPGAARAAVKGAGGMTEWVTNVAEWVTLDPNNHRQNGRYLYSFRGNASSVLDIYDIAANTWISGKVYGNQMETFNSGSCCEWYRGKMYITKEATGRFFTYDVVTNSMWGLTTNPYVESTLREGDKIWLYEWKDGETKIPFLFQLRNNRDELHRMMLI